MGVRWRQPERHALTIALAVVAGGCAHITVVPPTQVSGIHRVCVALAPGALSRELAAELSDVFSGTVQDELAARFQGLDVKPEGTLPNAGAEPAAAFEGERNRRVVVDHCDELMGIALGGTDQTGRCAELKGTPSGLAGPNRDCEHFSFQLRLLVTTPSGQTLADRSRQGDQWQVVYDEDSKQQRGPHDLALDLTRAYLRPMLKEALRTYNPANTRGLTVSALASQAHALGDALLADARQTIGRPHWLEGEDKDLRDILAGALMQWDDLQARDRAIGDPEKYRSTREGETFEGSPAEMQRFTSALIDHVTGIKEAARRARAQQIAQTFLPKLRDLVEAGRRAEADGKTAAAGPAYFVAEKEWDAVRAVYLDEKFLVPEEVPPDLWTVVDAAVRGRIRCDHVLWATAPRKGSVIATLPLPDVKWPEIPPGTPIDLRGHAALQALARIGESDATEEKPVAHAAPPRGVLQGRCVGADGKKCQATEQITSSWNTRMGTVDPARGTYELDLAVPVDQTIDIYCNGRRRGTKQVHGTTTFDLSCD